MVISLFQLTIALLISIVAMILLTRYKLHPFFSLLIASLLFGVIAGKSIVDILTAMQAGFGSLLQQIGLLVAIGSCLGIFLEKTGAMETISHRVLKWFGRKHSVFAMSLIGVMVGIPVFCDSGFIILSRLIPSIAAHASVNPAQLYLALSTGLYTTHTLVPPTPGPLAAAANLNMSGHMGTVIITGLLASLPVAFISFLFSRRLGKNIVVQQVSHAQESRISNLAVWKAFLPLALPIVLIASANLPALLPVLSPIAPFLQVAGHPVVALLTGLVISFFYIRTDQKSQWPSWLTEALKDAGIILLITGAGGAFGAVIKSSGIDLILEKYISDSQSSGVIFLLISFGVAAILKTAQGSTTSSMIIASSLLAPLASAAGFVSPTQLSVLIVAIGGGAMTISHANDSYFWVVSQFGAIAPRDAFRSFSVLTFLQGITALIMSVILFLLL